MVPLFNRVLSWTTAFARSRRGNVAIIFALTLLPITFLIGMVINYSEASQKQVVLDAAADAAALAAVDYQAMTQSASAAQTIAQNVFNAQTANIPGLTNTNLTVSVQNSGLGRTALVSYQAQSTNVFPGLFHNYWSITGSSQAASAIPPNIDFYLLLDNSPSMALAATPADITTMVNATQSQGGCAFACHESNPAAENPPLGNPGGVDNYTLAQQLGVTTRISVLRTATQQLMDTATATQTLYNNQYRMAVYTFATQLNTIAALSSSLSSVKSQAGNIDVIEVYKNNYLTSTNNNNDEDTNFDAALTGINSILPNPGNGSQTSTPQEVLFLVSDGVEDENVNGNRQQSVINTSLCTTIKNRGIRIAVLYTTYLPLPQTGLGSNSWYNQYIAPFQSNIGPTMQSCASPGLYFEVSPSQGIPEAMTQLFQQAVQTARLTQ
jgi:Putative Flp pilus-assembly TadE/G-like